MSKNSKLVLVGAAAVVVLLGGLYYWHSTKNSGTESVGESADEQTSLPTGANTDDASIQDDLSSIDAQLNGVASDNTEAAASVNAAAQ